MSCDIAKTKFQLLRFVLLTLYVYFIYDQSSFFLVLNCSPWKLLSSKRASEDEAFAHHHGYSFLSSTPNSHFIIPSSFFGWNPQVIVSSEVAVTSFFSQGSKGIVTIQEERCILIRMEVQMDREQQHIKFIC